MEAMAEIAGRYGIGALIIVVLCFISYLIIKHILKQSDKILDNAMQAQIQWQRAIDDHTSQAKEFHSQVAEAHRFQREEHFKIMENQSKITERLITLCQCSTEQTTTLKAITERLGKQAELLARVEAYRNDR